MHYNYKYNILSKLDLKIFAFYKEGRGKGLSRCVINSKTIVEYAFSPPPSQSHIL